tara:strand:+ start:199 stop:1056 length:858 start_codon:yes stop_codon:yes gene_type:complete
MAPPEKFLLAAVMGWPIMHSRSPLMHNFWLQQEGLNGAYLPIAIKPGKLESGLRALSPLGFAGCNLTMPHKIDAMKIVDEVDDVAKIIGAVSCIVVRDNGTLFGTNNDWIGFLDSLKHKFPNWQAEKGPVAIIGAGGGGRAVCFAMLEQGATDIRLLNRTPEEPRAIAQAFGGPINTVDWIDRHDALQGVQTVVNATNQGMGKEPALDILLDKLPTDAIVADIIYTPLETPFLAAGRKRGNPTINGLGMLLYQGIPAWRLWFGVEPTVTHKLWNQMQKSIEEMFN